MVKKRSDEARALKRAFDESGMTLTEFARRAGVKPQTAHGWINSTHGIRLGNLRKAARALKRDLSSLLGAA